MTTGPISSDQLAAQQAAEAARQAEAAEAARLAAIEAAKAQAAATEAQGTGQEAVYHDKVGTIDRDTIATHTDLGGQFDAFAGDDGEMSVEEFETMYAQVKGPAATNAPAAAPAADRAPANEGAPGATGATTAEAPDQLTGKGQQYPVDKVAKNPEEAIEQLEKTQEKVDKAQGKVDELNTELATQLEKVDGVLTEAEREQLIKDFKAKHHKEYGELDAALNDLTLVVNKNQKFYVDQLAADLPPLQGKNGQVTSRERDAHNAAVKKNEAILKALEAVAEDPNQYRVGANGQVASPNPNVAEAVMAQVYEKAGKSPSSPRLKALVGELEQKVAPHVLQNVQTREMAIVAAMNGGEVDMNEVVKRTNASPMFEQAKALYDKGQGAKEIGSKLWELKEKFDDGIRDLATYGTKGKPAYAKLQGLMKEFADQGPLGKAMAVYGVVSGGMALAKWPEGAEGWTEAVKGVAETAKSGAEIVLGISQVTKGLVKAGHKTAASRVVPVLGAVVSGASAAGNFAKFAKEGNVGHLVAGLGDTISAIGNVAPVFGPLIQGVGELVAAGGQALAGYINDKKRNEKFEMLLRNLHVGGKQPFAEGNLAHNLAFLRKDYMTSLVTSSGLKQDDLRVMLENREMAALMLDPAVGTEWLANLKKTFTTNPPDEAATSDKMRAMLTALGPDGYRLLSAQIKQSGAGNNPYLATAFTDPKATLAAMEKDLAASRNDPRKVAAYEGAMAYLRALAYPVATPY